MMSLVRRHFCTFARRLPAGCGSPSRKGTSGCMPAVVNSTLGSCSGMSGALPITTCPCSRKKLRCRFRSVVASIIFLLSQVAGHLSHAVACNLRRVADDRKKGCGGKSWASPACGELSGGLPVKRLHHHAAPPAPLLAGPSATGQPRRHVPPRGAALCECCPLSQPDRPRARPCSRL